MSLLLMILPSWEKNRSTYCEAALAFQGPTCQDVSIACTVFLDRLLTTGRLGAENMENKDHAARGL